MEGESESDLEAWGGYEKLMGVALLGRVLAAPRGSTFKKSRFFFSFFFFFSLLI